MDGRNGRQSNGVRATPSFSAHDVVTKFVRFARDYQGWSRSELARALGRDPTKIVPHSGNPKLDWIVRLAHVMDWPVGDLAEFFYASLPGSSGATSACDPCAIEGEIQDALRLNETARLVTLGRRQYEASNDARTRARACLREAIGWAEAHGRFDRVIDAACRGLRESDATEEVRALLMVHLSAANLHLWNLDASRGLATELIDSLERARGPMTTTLRLARASARVTRARASLRRIEHADLPAAQLALEAADDCYAAGGICHELQCTRPDLSGRVDLLASLAKMGAMHSEALRGSCTKIDAAQAIMDGATERPYESRGWSCIHAAVLAMGSPSSGDEHAARSDVAGSLRLASECAEASDVWPLRERVWTLESARRRGEATASSEAHPWVLEVSDLRSLLGVMGRFPSFRPLGWQILESARIVREPH